MTKTAVVAGHICLDVIPTIPNHIDLQPGVLYDVGAAVMATGGAVSNTGIAMHILGIPVSLRGKVGDDSFGHTVLDIVRKRGAGLADGIQVSPQDSTSYTMVINIPGTDRIFLHNQGANATFLAADVDYEAVAKADLFHFGYSSLMAGFYADGCRELKKMYAQVKATGATTSLDPAMPAPNGPAGKVDWDAALKDLLPDVDIFMPSADELLYMVWREKFGEGDNLKTDDIRKLGEILLSRGVAVAAVKLGSRGMYIRTAGAARLAKMGRGCPDNADKWADRELWFPIFKVDNFVGATGSGDTTIAGFLSAMLHSFTPEQAGQFACAVGACNVEAADALGGIRSWDETNARLNAGWPHVRLQIAEPGWHEDADNVWHGPADKR